MTFLLIRRKLRDSFYRTRLVRLVVPFFLKKPTVERHSVPLPERLSLFSYIMFFVPPQVVPGLPVEVAQYNRHSEWHEGEWCSDNKGNHEWLEPLPPWVCATPSVHLPVSPQRNR